VAEGGGERDQPDAGSEPAEVDAVVLGMDGRVVGGEGRSRTRPARGAGRGEEVRRQPSGATAGCAVRARVGVRVRGGRTGSAGQ
jgi:hypothetical protein